MNLTKNKIDVAIPYSMLRVSLNPITLSFSGNHKALEKPFREAYFSNSLDHVRRCKLYAILFFGIFGLLDVYVFPDQLGRLLFIRFAVVCPIFLTGLLFSYSHVYWRVWQPMNAFYIMVTGFAYVAMVVITPPPESYFYGVGTIFCVFFGYTFIHARFITASLAGLMVVGGYQLVMMRLMEVSGVIQLISGAHFIGINLLGMLICYSTETQQRKSFYLNHLLEKEREKTEDINRNLEQRVEERTAALQRINRDLNKEVAERKLAEQRSRTSRERLEIILDSIDADIYVVDIKTRRILLANRHTRKTFGSDIVGQPCHEVLVGRKKSCPQCSPQLLLDENGQPAESRSWEAKNPISGRSYIVYSRAVVWEDGRLVQLQVATDITSMQKMEARLQRAQKMEAIGTLAGGVAHDLNNILSGLVGYPELLLLDLPEGSETRTIVNSIKQAGEKSAAIVQDMLTLARRGLSVTDSISLNQVVTACLRGSELDKLKSVYPLLTIRTDLASAVFNTIGSSVHLERAVMNLITNAAEALPQGGVVTLSTQNVYLDRPVLGFETIPEGEYVRLRVADTGSGVAAHDLERIFEPFYTKQKMGRRGTGLGMAVVWGTVKDHRGFVDARSIEGQGSAIDLYLPVTRQDMGKEVLEPSIDSYLGNGELVLVVDDIKEQRKLAAFMLTRLNYRVDTVASGTEAVEYIKKTKVAVMVIDMILEPEMDGLDTYRQILAIVPGQKAIIASGFSESGRVLEAQRLGAGRYIKKPYRMEQIGAALREQLAANPLDGTINASSKS
jgi:two-component system cell cycle sensor histidine kinase/response regulator CckA